MKRLGFILLILFSTSGFSQNAKEQMLLVKKRHESILAFQANVQVHVDVSFITMPDKEVQAVFQKGEELIVTSEDFVLIPKRGLDLSFSELFEYPYLTVDRGPAEGKAPSIIAVSILPLDNQAEFSVANLHIDTVNHRILWAEINTKEDGTYVLDLTYPDKQAVLPSKLDVSFEIDRIKIPLNFAGNDVSVDRKKTKGSGKKSGKIELLFMYKDIQKSQK